MATKQIHKNRRGASLFRRNPSFRAIAKRIGIIQVCLVLLAGFLLSVGITLVQAPQTVSADNTPANPNASFTWSDAQTIVDSNGNRWIDSKLGDGQNTFVRQDGPTCPNQIKLGSNSYNTDAIDFNGDPHRQTAKATLHWMTPSTTLGNGNCDQHSQVITAKGSAVNTTYDWIDAGLIRHFSIDPDQNYCGDTADPSLDAFKDAGCFGNSDYQLLSGTSDTYVEVSTNACKNVIHVTSATSATMDHNVSNGSGGCNSARNIPLTLGQPENKTVAAGTGTTGGSNSGGSNCTGGATTANGACADDPLNCGAGGFDWLICPAIKLTATIADKFGDFIISQLTINTTDVFGRTSVQSKGYYTAWNSFRIIASGLLVIAGLVMVVSQALGFELLDAYTIRRTLPRLLVAIIGISLSWPLMAFIVQFFNVLGIDIRQVMYSPFSHLGGGSISVATGGLSTVALIAVFVAMGPAALTFLVTGALVFFVAYLILIMRQILLIILIMMAPLAIACYILPGTQRIWNLWRDNFIGLLLMLPLMSAAIAAGNIVSAVALSGIPH